MNRQELFEIVKNLEFDKKISIIEENGVELYLLRPSVLPKSLKNKYDVNKNFQIWVKEGEREFRPNHLRLIIDLNLRVRSNPELKNKLLLAMDNIFYGEDVEKEISLLNKEKFQHYLNPLRIIAYMALLFLIEQEYNYTGESKYDPKTLFLQGWIRESIDSPKELDNMCMSIANGQPPKAKYTCKENKKHKKYEEKRKELWYLEDQ